MRFEIPEQKKLVHEMAMPIRWGDMDAMGHVNNTLYFRYMEIIRIDWLHGVGGAPDLNGEGFVIVNAFCNFIRQLSYPGEVLARMYVANPGRSSFDSFVTLERSDEPGVLYATGGATTVWLNIPQGKAVPMPRLAAQDRRMNWLPASNSAAPGCARPSAGSRPIYQRSSDTHLIPLPLPGFPGIDLYLKDESSHPTGSLKHRLARIAVPVCAMQRLAARGHAPWSRPRAARPRFARPISRGCSGLPFVAVMPRGTSPEKIAAIEFQGGRCHLVDDRGARSMPRPSAWPRAEGPLHGPVHLRRAGHRLARATTTSPKSIYQQMRREPHPCPAWIVASAGTGGTLATLGRYVRYCRHATRVCGVDAEHSVFFDYYVSGDCS